MKKTFWKALTVLGLCLAVLLSLAACGSSSTSEASSTTQSASEESTAETEQSASEESAAGTEQAADTESSDETEQPVSGDSNILVAYFSWSGNTQQVAEWVSEKTGADTFRIVPAVEYTEDDVFDRSEEELESGTRPELAEHMDADTMAQYDVIFLGFPIWWYDLPMPVWTFLEEYDFSGKTIIPFFTHNGSSSGAGSLSTLTELLPDAQVLADDYFSHSGNSVSEAESDVEEWLSDLGYLQ